MAVTGFRFCLQEPARRERCRSSRSNASSGARWFPDSRRLTLIGAEKNHKPRTYELAVAGGAPKPIARRASPASPYRPTVDGWPRSMRTGAPGLLPMDGGPDQADTGRGSHRLLLEAGSPIRERFIAPVERVAGAGLQDRRGDGRSHAIATISVSDPLGRRVARLGSAFAPDGDHYRVQLLPRLVTGCCIIDGLKWS